MQTIFENSKWWPAAIFESSISMKHYDVKYSKSITDEPVGDRYSV